MGSTHTTRNKNGREPGVAYLPLDNEISGDDLHDVSPDTQNSFLNRLLTAWTALKLPMMKNNLNQLGAWIMLFCSVAFIYIINWLPSEESLAIYCMVVFVFAALLAHGIQRTTYQFVLNLGINFYILGWGYVGNSLLVANNNLHICVYGLLGVYMIFLGVVLYFMVAEEEPTPVAIVAHALIGSFLFVVGAMVVLLAYFEVKTTLFKLIHIRRQPDFRWARPIVTVSVGIGFLLISLYMRFPINIRDNTSDKFF